MYDAIIIGAGMSGLAAGIRLAYFDQRVCILERHTTVGGLNSFYRLDGRNYDVGLHAVTNFTPRGAKQGPLARLLKQLRMRWEDFALVPQTGSSIKFPGVSLRFSNTFELFESEIARAFPKQRDNFRRLVMNVADYDQLDLKRADLSARKVVSEYISDPLLVEMLFCPLMYYGSARENDMDFAQFCIMFRSIFMEGFARPFNGVRLILKHLVKKFKSLGGELRVRAGVQRMAVQNGEVQRVILDNGVELEARKVLSSAGLLETMRLCDQPQPAPPSPGQLSFVETISVLNQQPRDLGFDKTIVFFNDSPRFHWTKPQQDLVDLRSGVIASPNNFEYEEPLSEGMIRVTSLANYDRWNALGADEYRHAKQHWYDQVIASACRFIPDFRRAIIATDMFTPITVRRFTGHANGAVYGCPQKQWDGLTPLKNLFICGTDQGFVGIIGAIISGISMANRHILRSSV